MTQYGRQQGEESGCCSAPGVAVVKATTTTPPRSNGSQFTARTLATVESEGNDGSIGSNDDKFWEDTALLSKRQDRSSPPNRYRSTDNGLPPPTPDVEEGGVARRRPRKRFGRNTLETLVPNKRNRSVLLLNLVAVIWGSQHAIVKTVVTDSDPAAFTFLRFGLATLVAFPYLPGVKAAIRGACSSIKSVLTDRDRNSDRNNNASSPPDGSGESRRRDCCFRRKKEEGGLPSHASSRKRFWKPWRWGLEMGFWMFLGFSLQAVGLRTTTAQRSGFLLYLNVKFVPFFAFLLLGRRISCGTWISALAAFSGTAMLAFGGGSDGAADGDTNNGIRAGDLWSVAAAAASAMFILRLELASAEVPRSSELNATSLAVVAACSGLWWWLGGGATAGGVGAGAPPLRVSLLDICEAHPIGLVYLSVISTALANLLQTKAQKDVPAERASVIYSLDPVYGAVFSWAILGETLGGFYGYLGASVIFVAAAANSLAAAAASSSKHHQETAAAASTDDDDQGSELPPLSTTTTTL